MCIKWLVGICDNINDFLFNLVGYIIFGGFFIIMALGLIVGFDITPKDKLND